VDHVFVRGPIRIIGGRVDGARASDHRPVVAELELDGDPDLEPW
jgi:endonuclease/exonuclease/phosphatase (EEP) superfamily protein YafD